jgi:hypothetical protein
MADSVWAVPVLRRDALFDEPDACERRVSNLGTEKQLLAFSDWLFVTSFEVRAALRGALLHCNQFPRIPLRCILGYFRYLPPGVLSLVEGNRV